MTKFSFTTFGVCARATELHVHMTYQSIEIEGGIRIGYTVNNYMQVTGIATGENFAFFIYRHFVEIL